MWVVDNLNELSSAPTWILVRTDALPEIYGKALEMKTQLQHSPSASVSEVARRLGVSRSAYYKYKDAVEAVAGNGTINTLTVRVLLQDAPGVLSALLTSIAKAGANVLTVEQQAPLNGVATAVICVKADRMALSPEAFAEKIANVPGVGQVLDIQQEGGNER